MKPLPKGCTVALIVALAVVGLLAAAGYIFGPKLKALAHEQVLQFLQKEGLYIEYQTKYGRLDGTITLVDIVAYETSAKKKPVARLDHLVIRMGLRSLFRDHVLRTHLSTKNATFTVVGDPQTGDAVFEALNLHFDCRPGQVRIDRLTAQLQGIDIQATGDIQIDRGTGSPGSAMPAPAPAAATSPATPGALPTTPLDLSAILKLAPILDYRKATWRPQVTATIAGTHSSVRDSTWNVDVRSASFPSKGVDMEFAGQLVTGKDGNLTVQKAQLKHGKGEANVDGVIARGSDTFEIRHFDSSLDWVVLLRDYPAVNGAWNPVSATQAPLIEGSGSHHLKNPDLSRLTFTLRDFALLYEMTDKKVVHAGEIGAKGSLEKGVLRLNSLTAFLAKGNASGEVTYTPFATTPGWTATLKGSHLYLPDLVAPKDGKQLVGYVDFNFTGKGADKPAALQGQGKFSITNGDFFHTRVFGPLLLFLHKISNNPDKGNPQQLHASFQIQNGVVKTTDLALDISEAHVTASGTIDLVKETARFEARAKLRGPLGISVDLIGEGPLDNVEWRKK